MNNEDKYRYPGHTDRSKDERALFAKKRDAVVFLAAASIFSLAFPAIALLSFWQPSWGGIAVWILGITVIPAAFTLKFWPTPGAEEPRPAPYLEKALLVVGVRRPVAQWISYVLVGLPVVSLVTYGANFICNPGTQ